MRSEVYRVAEILCERLKEEFVIQRYDSYTTNSIYLKLDYGVCNSIRVSDHLGKRHLKYRYNIGSFIEKHKEEQDKFLRLYYRTDEINNLVMQVLQDKRTKLEKFGKEKYRDYMNDNQKKNADSKGFWKQAKLIN